MQDFGGEICGETGQLGDPGVVGRIILRWIFRKRTVELWTGSSWLGIGTGGWALLNAVMKLRVSRIPGIS
jgi:hypothetical protein